MIETTWDGSFDLRAALPRGARVGLLGCANCASVYRTGDTERLEAVAALLAGHADVVLQASVDAPCDQRVLRYLAKTLPGFDRAEVFVVLACEAGSRSVGSLTGKPVVSPVKTVGFSHLGTDGVSRRACLFCAQCSHPDRSHACPAAGCPLGRLDGPCQSRTSDRCVAAPAERCTWLVEHAGGAGASSGVYPAGAALLLPAALVPTPATLAGLQSLRDCVLSWRLKTLFLAPCADGLAPLVAAQVLAGAAPDLGVVFDAPTDQDLRTAVALGVRYVLLREPTGPGPRHVSTLSVIDQVRRVGGGDLTVAVECAFLHAGDVALLAAQLEAGAGLVVSRLAPGHDDAAARRFGAVGMGPEGALTDLTTHAGKAVLEVGDRCFG